MIANKLDLLVPRTPLSFYDYRTAGDIWVLEPEPIEQDRSGRVLLWLYFSIIARITHEQANTNIHCGHRASISSRASREASGRRQVAGAA